MCEPYFLKNSAQHPECQIDSQKSETNAITLLQIHDEK